MGPRSQVNELLEVDLGGVDPTPDYEEHLFGIQQSFGQERCAVIRVRQRLTVEGGAQQVMGTVEREDPFGGQINTTHISHRGDTRVGIVETSLHPAVEHAADDLGGSAATDNPATADPSEKVTHHGLVIGRALGGPRQHRHHLRWTDLDGDGSAVVSCLAQITGLSQLNDLIRSILRRLAVPSKVWQVLEQAFLPQPKIK